MTNSVFPSITQIVQKHFSDGLKGRAKFTEALQKKGHAAKPSLSLFQMRESKMHQVSYLSYCRTRKSRKGSL